MPRFTEKDTRPGDSSGPTLLEKVLETAEALVGLAELAVEVRGKPLSAVALAMKTGHVGLRMYRTWKPQTVMRDLDHFFWDEKTWAYRDGWAPLNTFVATAALKDRTLDGKEQDGWENRSASGERRSAVFVSVFEGGEVGWCGNDAHAPSGVVHVRPREMAPRLREIAVQQLWRQAGEHRVLNVNDEGFPIPGSLPAGLIDTTVMRTVIERVQPMWNLKKSRSYLIDGEPGTGKTSAALYAAQQLKASVITMPASALMRYREPASFEKLRERSAAGLTTETMSIWTLEVMAPDILVLNDVHLLDPDVQLRLVDILEKARTFTRVVFVTTNNHLKLIEPLTRPGRTDETIDVCGVSKDEVAAVLDGVVDRAYWPRLDGWPIADVNDVKARVIAHGEKNAERELEAVKERLQLRRKAYGRDERGRILIRTAPLNGHHDELFDNRV